MSGSILGHAVRRREDPLLVTGGATFVGDLKLAGCLDAAFVRSPLAHARILSIDATQAAAAPGVVAVLTAAELGVDPIAELPFLAPRPVLAADAVRFVGEPVAVVLAETAEAAADAAQLVTVDWEPLAAVADPSQGQETRADTVGTGAGALDGADVVVRGRFVNQRLAPAPMEANAIVAAPDPYTGGITVWAATQVPFGIRDRVVELLKLDAASVRVVAPAVGGGFGAKASFFPEFAVVVVMSHRLGRPVRWVETRTENFLGMMHGRAQVQDVALGATRDGKLVGLEARVLADAGAYAAIGVLLPGLTGLMSAGVYRMPKVDFAASVRLTNTTPIHAYRGAGRPEAAAMVERAMDMLAVELGMDPAELRRRNLLQRDEFPHTTVTGATYDSGDYGAALDSALELVGYESLRKQQAERRAAGDRRQLGIGMSVYVEVTGGDAYSEFGSVEVDAGGEFTVRVGTSSHGQGHETTFAQIAADVLGVDYERVRVIHSDTAQVPHGVGTYGSRSVQTGGTSVHMAALKVLDEGRNRAAELLEADAADIVAVPGRGLGVAGSPTAVVEWAEVARSAGPEGLKAELDIDQGAASFPFGCHIAVVEVDVETGETRLVKHVAVDDSGRIVNPLLADGQVYGGIAQGMAQALYEEVVYDADANPRTASLLDYLMPTVAEIPEVVLGRTVTPSPLNPLGAKGIGESGTIGSTPAIQNAVVDALAHLGVRHVDMPLSPERVWRAIQEAQGRGSGDGQA